VAAEQRKHEISISIDGQQVFNWTDYEISKSMIEPADQFTLTRAFDARIWNVCRRDARVRVLVDQVVMIDGLIDDRRKMSAARTMTIGGRCRVGRLVQESADRVNYAGLELVEAVRQLADPWYQRVVLSDARNRNLLLGKGSKANRVSAEHEPLIVKLKTTGAGKVQPGQFRWSAIEEIVSGAGLICWSSGDGKELIVGRPNYTQAPQFLIVHAPPGIGIKSTFKDLVHEESNGDRYSVIAVVGTGGATEQDFGYQVSARRAMVFDNEAPGSARSGGWSSNDGTGRDFQYPKRLLMPEQNFDSQGDAQNIAEREQARRDFRRTHAEAIMPHHGQFITAGAPTIFAPNTLAAVADYDFDPPLEGDYLIYGCTYRGSHDSGEETVLQLVPKGTQIVL
jgi:prophage tail gpP-like protein